MKPPGDDSKTLYEFTSKTLQETVEYESDTDLKREEDTYPPLRCATTNIVVHLIHSRNVVFRIRLIA